MRYLELVNQEDDACVAACIAMIAGVTLEEVLKVCPAPATITQAGVAAAQFGIYLEPVGDKLFNNTLCILSVPSLNRPGGMHCVVVDLREVGPEEDPDRGILFDPQCGREGQKYYSSMEEVLGWGEVQLVHYFENQEG